MISNLPVRAAAESKEALPAYIASLVAPRRDIVLDRASDISSIAASLCLRQLRPLS
jgi:hypothetical protein